MKICSIIAGAGPAWALSFSLQNLMCFLFVPPPPPTCLNICYSPPTIDAQQDWEKS
jgi:hypothetical protein